MSALAQTTLDLDGETGLTCDLCGQACGIEELRLTQRRTAKGAVMLDQVGCIRCVPAGAGEPQAAVAGEEE